MSIYIHIFFVILHVAISFEEFLREVGKRAQKVRQTLGFTMQQMSKATELGVSTIKNIEKGKAPHLRHYFKISEFTGISVSDLLNYEKPLPADQILKKEIIAFNEEKAENAYARSVAERPKLKQILYNDLLKTNLLNKGQSVAHIRDYIKTETGFDFTSPVISKALKEMVENGILTISKTVGRKHYYKKANNR